MDQGKATPRSLETPYFPKWVSDLARTIGSPGLSWGAEAMAEVGGV